MKTISVFAAVGLMASVAWAQDHTHAGSAPVVPSTPPVVTPVEVNAPAAPPAPPAPVWSDPEIAKLGEMLVGTWKSSGAISPADAGGKSVEMFLAAGHVHVDGLSDTLYVESGRIDALHRPSRQGVWQFYRRQGKVRLRTFEFRTPGGENLGAVGLWAAPSLFPRDLGMRDLVGTLDLEVTGAGADGFTAVTPHAYPTGRGGAVEMTSQLRVSAGKFESMDRGMSADGKIVWGPADSASYTFVKGELPVDIMKSEDGLVVFNYRAKTEGEPGQEGQRLAVHYVGSLTNGYVFDSSREKNQPFTLTVNQPLGVKGFSRALEKLKKGDLVRAIIPASLGYAERGNPRVKIPAWATLSYEIEVMDIEAAPVAETQGPISDDKAVEKIKEEMKRKEAERLKDEGQPKPKE